MDELIEKWHMFAGQPMDVIAGRFDSEGTALVAQVVQECLRQPIAAEFDSAAEFAEYVVDLRGNERAWSRRLGEVILQAQDLLNMGRDSEAKKTLSDFCAECPWRFFAEIASTQLENIGG
jgi:hypothetical protein